MSAELLTKIEKLIARATLGEPTLATNSDSVGPIS